VALIVADAVLVDSASSSRVRFRVISASFRVAEEGTRGEEDINSGSKKRFRN